MPFGVRQTWRRPPIGREARALLDDRGTSSAQRLLRFARALLPAVTFTEILDAARDEVRAAIGFQHVWLMVAEDDDVRRLRLLEYAGDHRTVVWDVAPVLEVAGDAFLEALVAADAPVVIVDARTDPRTNKALVAQLNNRTLINVPLRMLDRPFGIVGMGTFGDEGCRAPTDAELDYITGMASQIALAAGRIRFVELEARAEQQRRAFEQRLVQMQRLDSLGMLAGGIAHDFNNLLTVILSETEVARSRTSDPVLADDLDAVALAAERAAQLTHKLLAMSRQQPLTLQPLDLNAQLASLLALLRRVMPARIALDVIPGDRLPMIDGDPIQLDQVFLNISLNARDAMPAGGRLTLETEQVLVNGEYVAAHPWAMRGRYVLTTLTDTGVGMDQRTLDRLFEPFFTTKDERGTGLGLAVAHGIVTQHGGMLHAYSELGVGSTFKVYLPIRERLAGDVGTKIAGEVPRAGPGERVLVVDDAPTVRAVAARILEQAGYRVSAVQSGAEAALLLRHQWVDLVLLDVMMPGPPCGDVVAQLKAVAPGVRVLLASGYPATATVSDVARLGLELLPKPFDPDQLLRVVRRILDA